MKRLLILNVKVFFFKKRLNNYKNFIYITIKMLLKNKKNKNNNQNFIDTTIKML